MIKRLIIMILVSIMLVSAVAYASESKARSEVKNDAAFEENDIPVMAPDASDVNEDQDPEPIDQKAKDYEWNASRTFVVGEVSFHSKPEVGIRKGTCAEGRSRNGVMCNSFACDARGVYAYYNYNRLVKTALADEDAIYSYFSLDGMNWNGGGAIDKFRSECEPGSYFDGNVTDETIETLASRGKAVEYWFYIDWYQQDKVKEGDTVLIAVDPQLTVNPNYLIPGNPYNIKMPKSYSAVLIPFPCAEDFGASIEPHVAKFVNGKLQMPGDIKETFDPRRLYDDTDPELTGIRDGDSLETVVAFLKAVEQDMIRYEEEMRQQPAVTDVSSIR